MIPQISQTNPTNSDPMTDEQLENYPTAANPMVETLQQRHWLEWAELVSLLSSALGSVVVALSGQAIYGVAPLTVALSFNTANRYRLGQQVQLHQTQMVDMEESIDQLEFNTVKVILGLQQQLINELESVQHQLAEIPHQAALESAHTTKEVALLRDSVGQMQDQIAAAVQDLRQQFQQDLESHFATVSHSQEVTQTKLAELETMVQQWQENPLTSGQQSKLDQLFEENQTVIKPHLKRLILVVKQLQAAKTKSLPLPPNPRAKQSYSSH